MSEQLLWKQIKNTLQKNSQGKLLHSVLNTTTLESSSLREKNQLTLNVPSAFHQQVLKNHLSFIQAYVKKRGISFKINIQKPNIPKKRPLLKKEEKRAISKEKISPFSEYWTFCSFVQGPENCFTFCLAESIAKKPSQNNTNPLFIYGPSGVGKTHLLHAIGNYLHKEKPQIKTLYLPAERFFNDCINHIRKNEMSLFRQKYRNNIQVLLLDDVQILGKGDSTQEEFFHTFETLKNQGCQIVLASDQKPHNIKGLKERIKTRFEGGVISEIGSPDKDTRIAILKSKSQKYKLNLSEEIVSYIANIPTSSIRQLEGHLNKIKMFCELQNKKISLSLVQDLFKNSSNCADYSAGTPFLNSFTKDQKIKLIQKEVCHFFHIKLSEMKSRERDRKFVQARNIAMYIVHKNLKLSLTEMGWHFGKRDHSTVLYSLKNLKTQQLKDQKILSNINNLQNIIHNKLKRCV